MSTCSALQPCTICNNDKDTQRCGRCHSMTYCSVSCQTVDWEIHSLICSSFRNSTRPSPDHYRAILFNPDRLKPEITWLLCKWGQNDGDCERQMPQTDEIMGDHPTVDISIRFNQRLKILLPYTLYLVYRDPLVGSSPFNKSVQSLLRTKPGAYQNWRGPIIAYTRDGQSLDPPACRDLDLVDFRHLADYFRYYTPVKAKKEVYVKGVRVHCQKDGKNCPEDANTEEYVKGVRIHCQKHDDKNSHADTKRLHYNPFQLKLTDHIFRDHDTSDIANRIGIPILIRRCLDDERWAGDYDDLHNEDATFLHLCLDLHAKGKGFPSWGQCPLPWQGYTGRMIVVRKDRKPLLPIHMEAILGYCRDEVRLLLAHSLGEYAPEAPMERKKVLEMICRPMFVIYWDKLLKERRDFVGPGPYDV